MNVQGQNVILLIDDSGTWKPLACARTATINFTTDFIETSVSGSGLFASFLPTKNSFTISMDGVVSIAESGKLSIADLRALQFSQTLLSIKFQRTDDGGNTYTEECSGFISSSTDTGSYDGIDTFSLEIKGTGAVTQVSTTYHAGRMLDETGDFTLAETGDFILTE